MLVQRSGALALSSLSNVYQSLTKNSKGIFMLIVKYQLNNKSVKYYQGTINYFVELIYVILLLMLSLVCRFAFQRIIFSVS